MKKIYLAIPYTGREQESFEIANQRAADLMARGYAVFSPISHTHPIALAGDLPKHWEFWREYDICFLRWCDEVHVICLPGWEKSEGVRAEIEIARKLEKPIVFI